MPIEIRVPQLGESVVEATVARWLKQVGEAVAAGDAVVELETEKVNVEVPAEGEGVLAQIGHREGETVRVGDVLGTIDAQAGGAPPAPPAPPAAQAPEAPQAPAAAQAAQAPQADPQATPAPAPAAPPAAQAPQPAEATQVTQPATQPAASSQAAQDGSPHPVSPVARRLAEEHGIDPNAVAGSGPGGRVMKEDILERIDRAPAQAAPPAAVTPAAVTPADTLRPQAPVAAPAPAVAPPGVAPAAVSLTERREERVRLSRRRLTIARRLVEAQQTAAMLTTFNEIDMSAVMELRRRRRDAFKERHGVSLGFMSFFTRAVIGALKAFPAVNAELQGEELVLKHYYDVGIAVSTDEGLVVPVVRDADRKTFAQLEQEIADLATRARQRQLTLEDLRGGTFTITNGGVFGSLLSTPILNPPQVGILGMHKIEERPIAVEGQVVVRPMMYVALSYDHRVIDGREAVSYLVRVKELIEDPETLLLEG
ncbi:MAG TPA: 2-oxoglutarate dehydrogenase complex dihydrolipoyllysine-residue succinyltransferase [Chloroflexota bacterium]|nr:2-oxoglutarate dehydrogenase complex dihydrolipoyllysine-residue succinyltransferase [Chloroflexota bacterium]